MQAHAVHRRGLLAAAVLVTLALPCAVPAWGAKKPAWIGNQPTDPTCYHGVGMAEKKGQTASTFRDLARHRALRNLSMQISATVSSSFVLKTAEMTGMTEEQVKSEILTHTEACIEGYEFVDSYEDRSEYWEYYRYNKEKCRECEEKHRAQAIAAAATFIDEAVKAESQNEMVSAVRLYCQALHEIQDYFGGRPPELIKAAAALERLFAGMRLKADRAEMPALAGKSFRTPIAVTGVSIVAEKSIPARHLPVAFVIGDAEPPVLRSVTDGNGRVVLQIAAATEAMNGKFARARIDMRRLIDEEDLGALFNGFIGRLTLPEAAVALRIFPADANDAFYWHWAFAGRKVAVYAAYEADGKVSPWNKMRDEIAKAVSGAGATVVPGAAAAAQAVTWAAAANTPWTHDVAAGTDVVLIAVAAGKFNRRTGSAGQDCQFTGEIQTAMTVGADPDFADRYRGIGGWNPMGEEMCMDVLALHTVKRWQTAILKHFGGAR